jgi:hypothetical protein
MYEIIPYTLLHMDYIKNCSTKFVNLYATYSHYVPVSLHDNMILQKWTNVNLSIMRHKEYWISKDKHLIHLTTSKNADPPSPCLRKRKIQKNLSGSAGNETHC